MHKAIQAARIGREVLLHYYGRLEKIEAKVQAGLVSEADKESEKAIFAYLRKYFPDDDFVGEESALDLTKVAVKSPKRGRWIVDPLDGTTNYIHRFPVWTVSIGYEWDGQIQLGVIDAPIMGEVYSALRGRGAWMNGQRLQVSRTKTVFDSLLATGFFSEHEDNLQEQLRIFSNIVRDCRGVRRAGAASYDLCMVARGIFDAYWEKGLKPWDSAAGALLVEEAGGVITTYRGKKYHPFLNSVIAGNSSVVTELRGRFTAMLSKDTD